MMAMAHRWDRDWLVLGWGKVSLPMKDTVTKGFKHSTVGFNKNANCMYINAYELLIYLLINVSNIY